MEERMRRGGEEKRKGTRSVREGEREGRRGGKKYVGRVEAAGVGGRCAWTCD